MNKISGHQKNKSSINSSSNTSDLATANDKKLNEKKS